MASEKFLLLYVHKTMRMMRGLALRRLRNFNFALARYSRLRHVLRKGAQEGTNEIYNCNNDSSMRGVGLSTCQLRYGGRSADTNVFTAGICSNSTGSSGTSSLSLIHI